MFNSWSSDENLTRIYYGAIKYIHSKKLYNDIFDEFAAFVVIKYIENGFKMVSYDILFVDFMRYEFGRAGLKTTQLRNNRIEFNESQVDTVDEIDENLSRTVKVERLLSKLDDKEIKILTLISHGYSQKEVANIYNISESRISQIVKKITKRILKLSLRGEV